jgi:hypothetical protein
MADQFRIRLEGVEGTLRAIRNYPEVKQRQIGFRLKFAAQNVARAARQSAPGDEGQLRKSIYVDQSGPLTHTVGVQIGYAPFMEWGTKKYAMQGIPEEFRAYAQSFQGQRYNGKGGTLNENILAWVKRKKIGRVKQGPGARLKRGINAKKRLDNRQKGIAFLIARKIRKVGVKPRPFFFKNVLLERESATRDIIKIANEGL